MNSQSKLLVRLLAFSTLFFAILMPPEAYPAGRMAIIVAASFVFLISLAEKQIPRTYLASGLALFAILLLHSLLLSVDLYRSLEMMTVFWSYYCVAGFFIYSDADTMDWFAGSLVVLSLIVSLYGLYQFFWGFDQIYQYILYSNSDQVVKIPALQLIATKRVYSTLTLPGTLWGFLIVALPMHGILWRRSRILNSVLILSISLLLITGFLTRSFGFVAGLGVLLFAYLWLRHRSVLWNRATPIIIGLAIIAGLFYSARKTAIENSNPVTLRFANWISAWNIFSAHPFGTGLNTFGVIYPEYIQPGANETQFVHNTLLQLLSELGYVFVIAAGVIIVSRRQPKQTLRQWIEKDSNRFYLVLAAAGWILHNLIDIDIYFPSVGVLGIVLLALLLRREKSMAGALPSGLGIAAASMICLVVIVFSGTVLFGTELKDRAQGEYEVQKRDEAAATLDQAEWISPLNSSLYHDQGQILLDLYQRTRNPQFLERAASAFKTAIRLSPDKVGPHIGLGLCLSTSHKLDAARAEVHAAGQLYPGSAYVMSVSKLLEQQVQ